MGARHQRRAVTGMVALTYAGAASGTHRFPVDGQLVLTAQGAYTALVVHGHPIRVRIRGVAAGGSGGRGGGANTTHGGGGGGGGAGNVVGEVVTLLPNVTYTAHVGQSGLAAALDDRRTEFRVAGGTITLGLGGGGNGGTGGGQEGSSGAGGQSTAGSQGGAGGAGGSARNNDVGDDGAAAAAAGKGIPAGGPAATAGTVQTPTVRLAGPSTRTAAAPVGVAEMRAVCRRKVVAGAAGAAGSPSPATTTAAAGVAAAAAGHRGRLVDTVVRGAPAFSPSPSNPEARGGEGGTTMTRRAENPDV